MNRFIIAILSLVGVVFSHAETRWALVIGNNAYDASVKPDVPPNLENPVRDAMAVSESLRAVGFQVVTLTDASVEKIYEGLEDFKKQAAGAQMGLFYYSGHGVEVDGKNYLVPVDAKLESAAQLRTQAVALDQVLADMSTAKITAKMVVLDCCRDDPFKARSWRRTRSNSAGLATLREEDLPEATLLMFAAAPGQTAADGTGSNSPFTTAFVQEMKVPGVNCMEAFFRIADAVKASTGRQEPWIKFDGAGRTFRQFAFTPGESAAPTVLAKMSPLPTIPAAPLAPTTASLRVESTPAGLAFTVLPYTTEIEKLHADLNEKRSEWRQYTTEYAIKGLPAERNKFLKVRIGELDGEVKRLEGQLSGTPTPFARIGTTPAMLEGLNPGTYRVVMRCEGWPDQKVLTVLNPGAAGEAKTQFIGGTVKVVSEPSNATVTMDDKILGTTPLTLQGLPPGSRTLRVSKVGHSTQAVETIVEPGQTASLSAKLSKQANFDGTWMGSYVGKMSDGTIHTNQIRYTFSGTTLHVSCNGIDLPKARCKQIGNQMILSQHGIGTDGGEYHADSTFTMTEDGRSLAVSGSNRFGKTPQFNNTGGGTFRRVE